MGWVRATPSTVGRLGGMGVEDVGGLRETVIGAAIEVHRVLGPGFAEAVYERALCLELEERCIPFVQQAPVLVHYKDRLVGEARFNVRILRDGIRRVVWTHPQTSAASLSSPRLRGKKPIAGAEED